MTNYRFISTKLAVILMAMLLGLSLPAQAQLLPIAASVSPKTDTTPATAPAHDMLNRDTPRGTVTGLIAALSKEDWPGAVDYFDLSYMPKSQQKAKGPELAQQLQTLLNQGGWIMPSAMLSDDPEGKAEADLDADSDRVGSLKTGKQTADLLVHQARQTDGRDIWLVSPLTLKKIPGMMDDLSPPRINRFLPQNLIDNKFWGVPVGHWLALVVLAMLAYLAAWSVTFAASTAFRFAGKRSKLADKIHIFDALELPVRLYMAVWIFILSGMFMGVSALARQHFSILTVVVGWLSLVLFIWRFIDIVADRSQQHMSRRGKLGLFSVIHFVRRAVKFIFIATAAIIILGTFGVDVRAGIAALGIGGIALALGGQKTVENFIGSLMLILDQPVRLGDYCQIGAISGTVEDIGMRSTRLRTNDRTIVTIPNGDFSSQKIENFARRDRYLFDPTLMLRYDTTPDQLRWLLVKLRELLLSHPMVGNDPARARFTKFEVNSVNVEIFAYIITPDYDAYLAAQEYLLLRIMDLVAEAGTALAFNTHPAYNAYRGGFPPEQGQTVENQVRDWESRHELQLPKMDPQRVEEIKDTLPWPPPGSVGAKPEPS